MENTIYRVTLRLFPRFEEKPGGIYHPAPMQYALWQFLLENANEWIGDSEFVEYFEGKGLLAEPTAGRENESKPKYRTRVYRSIGVNQKRKINEKLLNIDTPSLSPPRLACHAYIGTGKAAMKLCLEPEDIIVSLERDISLSKADRESRINRLRKYVWCLVLEKRCGITL